MSLESRRVFEHSLLFLSGDSVMTNPSMTDPLGKSKFCSPRIIEILGKQNSLFPKGPSIKC